MTTLVVPFAGANGKTRLHLSTRARRALSLAMLADVLSACVAVGSTRVTTPDPDGADVARDAGAEPLDDPGGGQGAAVRAALDRVEAGPVLVVNADVPCVVPQDLRALLEATPPAGIALVEALDGTTNALGLGRPEAFAPLYGRDSAARFRAHAASLGISAVSVALPNVAEDVDTLDDLRRLQLRCGPRTQAWFAELPEESVQ